MPPSRIPKTIAHHAPKQRPFMDKGHLANIRLCPCACCGAMGCDPHHLLRTEERGLSRKSSDRWALPLDRRCHLALHAAGDEESYLASKGIDGRALASALWAARGDLEAMKRIVFRARQRAMLAAITAS